MPGNLFYLYTAQQHNDGKELIINVPVGGKSFC
jgi:hypothetical protein